MVAGKRSQAPALRSHERQSCTALLRDTMGLLARAGMPFVGAEGAQPGVEADETERRGASPLNPVLCPAFAIRTLIRRSSFSSADTINLPHADGSYIGPYRFFFYAGDREEPPHIHVERDEHTAKFWLDEVRLRDSRGFGRTRSVGSRSWWRTIRSSC